LLAFCQSSKNLDPVIVLPSVQVQMRECQQKCATSKFAPELARGGLMMSLDGGVETLPEFLRAAASWAVNSATCLRRKAQFGQASAADVGLLSTYTMHTPASEEQIRHKIP
jgi:hypothetical protein